MAAGALNQFLRPVPEKPRVTRVRGGCGCYRRECAKRIEGQPAVSCGRLSSRGTPRILEESRVSTPRSLGSLLLPLGMTGIRCCRAGGGKSFHFMASGFPVLILAGFAVLR